MSTLAQETIFGERSPSLYNACSRHAQLAPSKKTVAPLMRSSTTRGPVTRDLARLADELSALGGDCAARVAPSFVLARVPGRVRAAGGTYSVNDERTQLCATPLRGVSHEAMRG
jgi:hypothetical protein